LKVGIYQRREGERERGRKGEGERRRNFYAFSTRI
jgi:hypothetical protein